MSQDFQEQQERDPTAGSGAPKVMPHEDSQPATSLDGEGFNEKLRNMVSTVKHGFRSEVMSVDFKEVCEDKVRFLNEGDNLSLLLIPLTADGAHGRAFLELFDAGTDGDNILRFCQQELNMSADEATQFLTPPKQKGASKGHDVVLPLSLESASPWVKEFMAHHWNVPGVNIALAVRHTGERVSVGVCLGFEPLRTDVAAQPIREERSWGALRSGFATFAEVLGPFGGLIENCVELTQIVFCLPTAVRKDLWGAGTKNSELAVLSGMHFLLSGLGAAVGTMIANAELGRAGMERWAQFNDFNPITKYCCMVLACNLASFVYELGYERYQLDKRAAAEKSSKQGGAS
jgi:hypothetical protein